MGLASRILDFDLAREREFRRPRQLHVAKPAVLFLKADFELVAALDLHLYGGTESVHPRSNQRGGCHPGTAGQRFALDAALERPYTDMPRPEHLNKIDVSALRSKMRVPADLRAEGLVLASRTVMGNGVVEGIRDIVYLRPDRFEPRRSRQAAEEVAARNDALLEAGRSSCHDEERKRTYARLQEILAEDQPVVFLYFRDALPVVSSRVHGIVPAANGIRYNFPEWYVPKRLQRYTAG